MVAPPTPAHLPVQATHAIDRLEADNPDEIECQSIGRHQRPCHERKAELEENDCDAIVELALAIEQHLQTLRDAQALENWDVGDGMVAEMSVL
jgi:hypothetical protein